MTYDQKTIPPILMEWALSARHHIGVIFVDKSTVPSENIGALTQALITFYDKYLSLEWTDVVMFLSPTTR